MYTVPSAVEPPKPNALYGGAVAALLGLAAAGVQGFFWIRVYDAIAALLPYDAATDTETRQVLSAYNSFVVVVVVIGVLISLSLVAGAVFALRGANGGRIAMWIAGGVAIAWNLCCSGYVLFFRTLIAQAVAQTETQGGAATQAAEDFPVWMVDTAVGFGFAVAIASIASVTLIALPPVNRYYRWLRGLSGPSAAPMGPGRW